MKLLPLKGGEKVFMGRDAPDGRYYPVGGHSNLMADLVLTPTDVLYASGNYCMDRADLAAHYPNWILREDQG